MASAAKEATPARIGLSVGVTTANSSPHGTDPFDGILVKSDPDFPGLPQTINIIETAAKANITIVRGASQPEINGATVSVPLYYSSHEARQLIAEAIAKVNVAGHDAEIFPLGASKETAFASVLLMPRAEFAKWVKKKPSSGDRENYTDSQLGSLFNVAPDLVALRREIFTQKKY